MNKFFSSCFKMLISVLVLITFMPIQSYANQNDELPTILSSSISDKIIAYKGVENLGFTTIKFETNEPVVATVQVSSGTTSTSIKLSDWLKKKSQYELYFVPMNYEKAYHDQFVSLPPGKYSVSVNIVDESYNRSIIGIGTIEVLAEEKKLPLIEILDVKITNESKSSKIEPKIKFQYKVNRPAYLELPVFRDYANSFVEGERTQIDILTQSSNYLAPGIYEAEWNLRPPKRFFRNNRGVIIMQPNDRTIVPPDEYKLFFRAQEDSIKKYAFQESFGTIPDEKTIDIAVTLKDNNAVVQIINGWTPLFEDIQDHWAKADILFLNSKNIIKGSGNNKFYPDNNITRAEFITMLARSMNLADKQNNTAVFTDIKSTDWYFNTVMAAANAGLVKGNDKGQFAPNALITREEIAVLSVRALEYKKATAGAPSSDMLSIFNDNSNISSWAKAYCNSAVSMELLKGKPGNLFAPKAYATRAESAVILKRLLDQIEK